MSRIKRTKKRKWSELVDIPLLPQPEEMSATQDLVPPVKKEEKTTASTDTRFETSNTLLPDAKRQAISDDCIIIENAPQTEVKIEIIDLTDDFDPIVPTCSPLQNCSQEKRLSPLCETITKTAEMKKEVDFDESVIVPSTDNLTEVKNEPSKPAENLTASSEYIHSTVNENEAPATQNTCIKSEPDKENKGVKLVSDEDPVLITDAACNTENLAEPHADRQFPDVPMKLEPSENHVISENSTSVTDDRMRTSINPVDPSVKRENNETDGNSKDTDFLSWDIQPGKFPCHFIKYLNCHPVYDSDEIKECISVLINLMKDKEEIIEIESEEIPESTDSQDQLKLRLADKKEELPNLQINEKISSSLEVDRTVHKISSKELVDVKPNIARLDSKLSFKEFVDMKPNISNLDSSQLEKSINERQVQVSLNRDGFGDEIQQNVSTNMRCESASKMSESSRLSYCGSHTIDLNSPMDTDSPAEDDSPSIISLSPIHENNQSKTTNRLPKKAKKNLNEELLSTNFLRQILDIARCSDDTSDISSSVNTPLDPVIKSNVIIDGNIPQNKSQINLSINKLAGTVNSVCDENEKAFGYDIIKCHNSSEDLCLPCGKDFKPQDVPFNLPPIDNEPFEVPPKRIKMSETPLSTNGSDNKLTFEDYKKRITGMMAGQHFQPDCHLSKHLSAVTPPNLSDCAPSVSNFNQNAFLPPGSYPNRSFPISNITLGNPVSLKMINTSPPQDPRLVRNCSPASHLDMNSPRQLSSLNIHQTNASQILPATSETPIHPLVTQTSVSRTSPSLDSSSMQSLAQTFNPCVDEVKNQKVKQWLSQIKSYSPSDLNERSSEINSLDLHPSPALARDIFYTTQCNPIQLVQGVNGRQPLPSLQRMTVNASATLSQHRHVMSEPIHPPMSLHLVPHQDQSFSDSDNREYSISPPLSFINHYPPIVEMSPSIASTPSASSLSHNQTKLMIPNTPLVPSQSSFVSLFPKRLRENIGRNVIDTNDIYFIIIEKNVDCIHGIDKETDVSKISKIGCQLQQVRDNYENHLMYYNTYFPLLLLDCFSKISMALKAIREKRKTEKNICKVIEYEKKESYVRFKCESFIHQSYVENIPKDGHIVLVKFATIPRGSVTMLGYVCSSTTRAYSNRHDDGNDILKYLNVSKSADIIKIKITFHTVFALRDINLSLPIYISKLTSIKKALVQNEALKELPRSPLCDAVLSPRNHDIKGLVLPRRQDINPMSSVVHGMVQSLNPSSPQITVIESPPNTDSFLAIVQIVEEIKRSDIPGKVLVCVRSELLSQMGMNLIETPSNFIILSRKREGFHENLQNRFLEVVVSNLSKAQFIHDHAARSIVLQEADVLLAVTGTCFYESVKCIEKDLKFCIIHDAHCFPEPESLLPLLYGIRHLFLIGDPDDSCYLSSKCATFLGYNKSLFHRVYNLR